ncbi:MAG: hypothetical protein H0W64_04745 [Gammaproteobacteria bacterium]|nr:hypothetical protein [Gammaproteobacteria bacterium]
MISRTHFSKSPKEEQPFTEIFKFLTNIQSINPSSNDLQDRIPIKNEIENALNVLLIGLQDIAYIMSITKQDKPELTTHIDNVDFFNNTMINLIHALNDLRLFLEYKTQIN